MARFPEKKMKRKVRNGGVIEVYQCTALSKNSQERCRAIANNKNQVCKVHGSRAGRKPNTGKFSKYLSKSLKDKTEEFEKDEDITSLKAEIATTRAAIAEFMERFKESGAKMTQKELDWVTKKCETVGVLSEREHRMTKEFQLKATHIEVIIAKIIAEIIEIIPDEETRAKIAKALQGIKEIRVE